MTQRGPVPLPVTARYSVPLRLGVRVRGNQWRCGRWPGQAGPLKGPCQWAGARLPETAAGLGSTGTGRHWQWLQLEVASATVAGPRGENARGRATVSWPTGVPAFRHRRPKVSQLRRASNPSFLSSNLSKSLGAEWTRLRKLMGTKVGGL